MTEKISNIFYRPNREFEIRETSILWIFALVAIVLSLGPLFNGGQGYFRIMDTTDMYFDKVRFLVNFWKDPEGYSWTPFPMRGWPSNAGSLGPQHLLVLLATQVAEVYAFIIFRIIIDFFTMAGMFLFAKRVAAANTPISIVAALILGSSYYWYDENIVVTAAQLLPLLVVVTASHEKWPPLHPAFKMMSFFVLFTASYPAYTLPLMPLAQGVMLLVFLRSFDWKKTIIYGTVFWVSFLVFHGQSILSILDLLSESNRSLWVPMEQSSYPNLYSSVISFFTNDTFIYPAFLSLFFINKANYKVIVVTAVTALVLLTLACFQSSIEFLMLSEKLPALNYLNSTLHRCLNFVPIALTTGMIIALKKTESYQYKWVYLVGVYIFYSIFISTTLQPNVNRAFEEAMILGGIYLLIIKLHFHHIQKFKPIAIGLMCLMVLIPSQFKHKSFRQAPQMGRVYIDNFNYPDGDPYRAVTLMPNHFSPSLYPAQVSIKGVETFDGFSVFYDRDDADFWQKYIDGVTNTLQQRYGYSFNNWNNRIEFTMGEFYSNADHFIKVFKFNNVRFLRSYERLNHDQLDLVQTTDIGFENSRKMKEHFNPFHQRQYQNLRLYLYEIRDHLPRMFIVNQDYPRNDLPVSEQRVVRDRIEIMSYKPGRIDFSANARPGEKIFISSNYSEDWSVLVNGERDQSLLKEDAFGLMSIIPKEGAHKYTLIFKNSFWIIIFQMLIGLAVVGLANNTTFLIKTFRSLTASRFFSRRSEQ